MRTRMVLAAVAAAFVLALSGTAAADVVYSYSFDGLSDAFVQLDGPNGTAGQDGWRSWSDYKNGTSTDTVHRIKSDDQGLYKGGVKSVAALLRADEAGRDLSGRPNDANWSYAIPAGSTFTIEFYTRIGAIVDPGGPYLSGYAHKLGLFDQSDLDTMPIEFGFAAGTGGNWWVWGGGTKHESTTPAAHSGFDYYFLKLEVDLAANGGEGAASLYADLVTSTNPLTRTGYVAVDGLQNLNLGLLTAGVGNPSNWAGLRLDMDRGSMTDEITITVETADSVIPEPASIGLIGLAFVGLRKRRA